MSKHEVVESASELLDAVNSDATIPEVRGTIAGMPMVTLKPGVTLRVARCNSAPSGFV